MSFDDFTVALALGDGQPGTALEALHALAQSLVGAKLFTLTTVDPVTAEYGRIYSSNVEAYPLYGHKPADETEWSAHVLRDRKVFVANDIGSIATLFPDHVLIRSLGCESVVNLPVEYGGQVIGTVNLLHEAGYWTPEKAAACAGLRLPSLLCFLLSAGSARGSVQ
jgi:GAF domain-containing protein